MEHLEQDFVRAGGLVEHEVDVGAHGDLLEAADVGNFIGILGFLAHAVQVQDHHEGQDGVVVAEAEIGTLLSGGDALIGLCHDVFQDGHVAQVGLPGVPVELEIVDFPEGDPLFRGEDVGEDKVRVQAGHAGGVEIQVRYKIPLLLGLQGFILVDEDAVQDGAVVDGPFDVLLPRFLEGNRRHFVVVVAEGVAAVQGQDGGQEKLAEVLENVQLGVPGLESQAEGAHGHDAAGAGGCPGADVGIVLKNPGEVAVHTAGQLLLLTEALAGEVSGPIFHIGIKALEALAPVFSKIREVLFFLGGTQHLVDAFIQIALPGITGTVTAVMAQVEGLVTSGSRG